MRRDLLVLRWYARLPGRAMEPHAVCEPVLVTGVINFMCCLRYFRYFPISSISLYLFNTKKHETYTKAVLRKINIVSDVAVVAINTRVLQTVLRYATQSLQWHRFDMFSPGKRRYLFSISIKLIRFGLYITHIASILIYERPWSFVTNRMF